MHCCARWDYELSMKATAPISDGVNDSHAQIHGKNNAPIEIEL